MPKVIGSIPILSTKLNGYPLSSSFSLPQVATAAPGWPPEWNSPRSRLKPANRRRNSHTTLPAGGHSCDTYDEDYLE
jgi:hypothetical protein